MTGRRSPPGYARAEWHGERRRAVRGAGRPTRRTDAYAALVRLVEQAQAQRAPFMRMADRYAGFFLPATVLVAGAAWVLSGDVVRALAVVVVATPCPADPGGADRARLRPLAGARAGVIVKGFR